MTVLLLLVAYGLCFYIQNKALFLHEKVAFFDSMFECSFCTGFHCGWITWFAYMLSTQAHIAPKGWHELGQAILFGFASAACCYILDTTTQLMEKYIHTEE